MIRRSVALLATCAVLGACVAGPSGRSGATGPAASEAPGDALAADVLLEEHTLGPARWAPDGHAFGIAVSANGAFNDRVDILTGDGRRLASYPNATDVAWLDSQTLVTLQQDPNSPRSTAVIHDLDGSRPDTSLPGDRGTFVGSGAGRLAIPDRGCCVADASVPVRVLANWDPSLAPDNPAFWSETEPIEDAGWPVAWSPDGSLLALARMEIGAAGSEIQATSVSTASSASLVRPGGPGGAPWLGAGSPLPNRLVVVRFPGAVRVPVPDLLFEPFYQFSFSPDNRLVAGIRRGGDTVIVDLGDGSVHLVAGMAPVSWTRDGSLLLIRDGTRTMLWHPDGSVSDTGLPPGLPTYGPRGDEVAIVTSAPNGGGSGQALVRAGGSSVTILLRSVGGAEQVSWSPDGSVCLVSTGTDNVGLLHDRLLRVAVP